MQDAAPRTGTFGYFVNLDERGIFRADVRDTDGETVFEIHCEDDEGWDIFEDGWMSDKTDVTGLQEYLVHLGVLDDAADLLPMAEFEDRVERETEETPEL